MIKKFLLPVVLFLLRISAQIQLLKVNPTIIGIAGSSGKTSLVALVGGMLSKKYKIRQTSGQNSETGLPLFILGIKIMNNSFFDWMRILCLIPFKLLFNWKVYDIFVAEMGIDSPAPPKNMEYLLKIIRPSIAAVTNISLEHSVYFEPFVREIDPDVKKEKILEMTAKEETLPLVSLPQSGTAILNLDDKLISEKTSSITSKKITVSLTGEADLMAKDIVNTVNGFSMKIIYTGKEYSLAIHQPLPRHFAYSFLMAVSIGLSFEMSVADSMQFLEETFHLPAGRMSFFKGIKETVIIDSTYNNATLPPILDILNFVHDIAGNKRKVAILGDMRELGEEAEDMHVAAAEKVVKTMDFAILIGPLSAKYMTPVFEKMKFPYEDFPDVTSAREAIKNRVQHGDFILVKGSQNTLFLERIVEMLLLDKKDVEKLTRRGAFWDKKRSESL